MTALSAKMSLPKQQPASATAWPGGRSPILNSPRPGLLWFAGQKVDIVIFEVGLGGRLDATNVITPLVSIITNVSMDHGAHLGTTLAQIAAEKAGIVKRRIPVVSGVAADVSLEVVSRTCLEQEAPLYLLGRDFKTIRHDGGTWDYQGPEGRVRNNLPLLLKGGHQVDNTAIALAALDLLAQQGFIVSEENIRAALARVRWPGRLEYFCRDCASGKTVDCPAESLAADDGNLRRYLLGRITRPVLSLYRGLDSDCLPEGDCVWASRQGHRQNLNAIAPYCHRLIFAVRSGRQPLNICGFSASSLKGGHCQRQRRLALAWQQRPVGGPDLRGRFSLSGGAAKDSSRRYC
jgi:hypothetical protein